MEWNIDFRSSGNWYHLPFTITLLCHSWNCVAEARFIFRLLFFFFNQQDCEFRYQVGGEYHWKCSLRWRKMYWNKFECVENSIGFVTLCSAHAVACALQDYEKSSKKKILFASNACIIAHCTMAPQYWRLHSVKLWWHFRFHANAKQHSKGGKKESGPRA